MTNKKIKDIYDYTKPPLNTYFNPMFFLNGRRNCKIIVNKIQFRLVIGNGLYEDDFFEELKQRNIELEVNNDK